MFKMVDLGLDLYHIYTAVALCIFNNPACPEGKFRSGDVCEPCPIGTYRHKAEDLECTPCPDGETTLKTGGISIGSCYKGEKKVYYPTTIGVLPNVCYNYNNVKCLVYTFESTQIHVHPSRPTNLVPTLQMKPMLKRSQIPLSTMQNGICEVTALICNDPPDPPRMGLSTQDKGVFFVFAHFKRNFVKYWNFETV